MTYLDPQTSQEVVALADIAVAKFGEGDWNRIGYMTGCSHIVGGHGRLLRSLSWGDPDYDDNALEVLGQIVKADQANLKIMKDYVASKYDGGGITISTAPPSGKTIRFSPSIFRVPDAEPDPKLVAVMMPFAGFDAVYGAIREACSDTGHFYAQRADDFWQDSTVMQDVFSLIFRSYIVVCDFTDRNPNVFYEAGLAHALGKIVVPITQKKDDIPSDLIHHRYLHYLNNGEGLVSLRKNLRDRLNVFAPPQSKFTVSLNRPPAFQ